MRYLLTIFMIICCVCNSKAQIYTVKGNVKDTLNAVSLPLSSIVLINTKDSVITSYTRTDTNGSFSLSVDKPGKYLLRITFPSFADYTDVMDINKSITDIGTVAMITKEHLLKEFVLTKQISAIKIKGDTTEYVADSFKVKDNANVEDLLKKLPGIQVDKNGQITAQGQTVQKILVDGEEFFSDDPKVVTEGLEANAVDKVQVYDKKSDQAEFTGIDDGQKTKTINLQLKENKKKGYFGKLDVGGGTDGYFQNQAMINAFKGKRQFSAFGIISNTDKVGLGWQDNGKFGSGNETISDEDGNTYSILNSSDENFGGWDGRYNGEGLPQVWTGGIHYADKWNEAKNHIVANYRFGQQEVNIDGNSITQNGLLGDTSNVSVVHKTQFSKADRHGLDAMYEFKIDSNNTIKLSASAGNKTSRVLSVYHTTDSLHTTAVDAPLYTNNRSILSNTNADFINADLLYKKKFAKKGRTLSVDVKENYKISASDGYLNSTITPGKINAIDSIDQAKKVNSNTLTFFAKATYTEPISKIVNMEISYSSNINNTTAQNYSYNKIAGSYTDRVDSLSSDYKYNILTNTGGLNLRWVYTKINFSVGGDVSRTNYLQTDLLHGDTSYRYNYLNLFPKFNFRYKVSNQSAININYYGSTQQPTITQIQPLKQNIDPTNITIGNPNLKQEFINRVEITYNDYKVLTHRWIWSQISANTTNNAISLSQTTSNGINTNQYINVNGNYDVSGWIGYGFKINKPDISIGGHLAPGINHSINIVNDLKNTNDNNSYNIGFDFNKEKEDKYEFHFSPSVTYSDNKATISTYTTNYWISDNELAGSVQLSKTFEISTSADFMFRERTVVFTSNNNVIKWNATASKKFLKKKNLVLKASVFDILNQNIGYTRTAQANIITQNNYNTIRRHGMISLVWNFTHRPGELAAANNDDE